MSTAPQTSGPPEGAPSAWLQRRGVIGVTVVCLLAGVLFGTSASLAQERPLTGEVNDLVGLITARDGQVQELNEEVEGLRAEVETLERRVDDSEARKIDARADAAAPQVGLAAVSGPAVEVTLDDAGYTRETLPEGYSVDDVVVHQQDLQGVVNALWAGGAEAIMVQGHRIISTSSVQCVGNTLYLQGRVYSPPYTVTAVGDPDRLHDALAADPVVSTYRQWAEVIGLGYEVKDLAEAELPAYTGVFRPTYARVAEDVRPAEPAPGQG